MQSTVKALLILGLLLSFCAPESRADESETIRVAGLSDFFHIPWFAPKVRPEMGRRPVLTAAAPPEDENLAMGLPTNASTEPNDFLMVKSAGARKTFALSYNNSTGEPNWVEWHLNSTWIGDADRDDVGRFHADTALPKGFVTVRPKDYANTGFDKGHMCNFKDRSIDGSSGLATFVMTNMVPQAPSNNRHTWEGLEEYARDLARRGAELFIVSGPMGSGGVGDYGPLKEFVIRHRSQPLGKVVVPEYVWKVILVLPHDAVIPNQVSSAAQTIAVIIPNTNDVVTDWRDYIVTVSDVESELKNMNFFSALDASVAGPLKAVKYHP